MRDRSPGGSLPGAPFGSADTERSGHGFDRPVRRKKLYFIGHMCPDLDTVGSAIVYAKFLRELGYDAEPRITMAPNAQPRFALSYCGIPIPEILTDAAGKDIVLVDISDDVNTVAGHPGLIFSVSGSFT